MYYLEHEGFSDLVTTEEERDQLWDLLVSRVIAEAEMRGGSSEYTAETHTLTLMPPYSYEPDETIKLQRETSGGENADGVYIDHHNCWVTTGMCYVQNGRYVNFEDNLGVLQNVLNIMNGRAIEAVYVKKNGTWVGTASGSNSLIERFSFFPSPEGEEEKYRVYTHALTAWLEKSSSYHGSSGGIMYLAEPAWAELSWKEKVRFRLNRWRPRRHG